jgi:glutamate synthase domain-containing protein 2
VVVLAAGIGVLSLVMLYVSDRTQTESTILRNYPAFGRFLVEHLGEVFRQKFFAMDREEMPFNCAQRSCVYCASTDLDNTVGFGPTRDLRSEGMVMFINSAFPPLTDECLLPKPIIKGQGYCAKPYTSTAMVNHSGMSFGAISKAAVLGLSHGVKNACCWTSTGEADLSQYHEESGCDFHFK